MSEEKKIEYGDIRDDKRMQALTQDMPEEKFEGYIVYMGPATASSCRKWAKIKIHPHGDKRKKDHIHTCYGAFPDLPRNMPVSFAGKRSCKGAEKNADIYAWNICPGSSYIDDAVEFLYNGNFGRFNHVTAKHFLERYEGNLFKDEPDENLENKIFDALTPSMPKKKKKEYVRAIASYVRRTHMERSWCSKLSRYGFSYATILKMCSLYGDDLENALKENPFGFIDECGAPFSLVDRLWLEEGGDPYAPTRLEKAVLEAVKRYEDDRGSTYMYLPELIFATQNVLSENGKLKGMEPLTIINAIENAPGLIHADDSKNIRYMKAETAHMEEAIAENVMRLNKNTHGLPLTDEIIASVEKEMGFSLGNEQCAAMKAVSKSGVSIIQGFPGSGKTTMIRALVLAYRAMTNQNGAVYLCAPTGKAADRLTEAVGMGFKALTVHKTLNLVPVDGDPQYGWKVCPGREAIIDEPGLVVLDEATMLDMDIAAKLFEAIPTGSCVILVGDPAQLPSVKSGRVLFDLSTCGAIPVYTLKTVYRQGRDSATIYNAEQIRNGKTELKTDDTFEIIRTADAKEAAKKLEEIVKDRLNESSDVLHTQILTTIKDDENVGTHGINEMMQRLIHGKRAEQKIAEMTYLPGDKVIFTRNNSNANYMNGDIGIVKEILPEYIKIELPDKEGEDAEICLSYKDFADLDLAYAMTVHKSQGSEWDTVITVLPAEYPSMLQRNLIYTAITRAKQHNIVITVGNSLERGIEQNDIIYRRTMLGERFRRLMGLEEKSSENEIVFPAALSEDLDDTLLSVFMENYEKSSEHIYDLWELRTNQVGDKEKRAAFVSAIEYAKQEKNIKGICLSAYPQGAWGGHISNSVAESKTA